MTCYTGLMTRRIRFTMRQKNPTPPPPTSYSVRADIGGILESRSLNPYETVVVREFVEQTPSA